MKSILFVLTMLSPALWAAHSQYHTFMCNVVSFDKKMVTGQCDPSKPKVTMKIPRAWLDQEQQIRVNTKVKFMLKGPEFDRWMAMNQPSKKRK